MIIMMTTIAAAARIVTGAITKSSLPVAMRAAGRELAFVAFKDHLIFLTGGFGVEEIAFAVETG